MQRDDASLRGRAAAMKPRGTGATSVWPPAVVGVLAEDLEPSGHPERVFGGAASHALERFEDEVEENPFSKSFVVAETEVREPGREVGGGQKRGRDGAGVRRQESGAGVLLLPPISYLLSPSF